MNNHESAEATRRPPLYRNQQDRVLGGVCAGIAQYVGLDTTLVRLGALVLAALSGGVGALAYLVAWIVIPPTPDHPVAPERLGHADEQRDARAAWNAAGDEIRTLAAGLRPTGRSPGPHAPADAQTRDSAPPVAGRRPPVEAVDTAMTALGDRLRDPQVQADARRAAARVATALNASVEDFNRRAPWKR